MHAADFFVAAKELQRAALAPFVVEIGQLGGKFGKHRAAVGGDAHHPFFIDAVTRLCAVAKHLPQPGELEGAAVRTDDERRMRAQHPFQRLDWNAGRRPRRGVAVGKLPGVGVAGFQRWPGGAVDDADFVSGLGEIPGAADAADAGSEDDDFHGLLRLGDEGNVPSCLRFRDVVLPAKCSPFRSCFGRVLP